METHNRRAILKTVGSVAVVGSLAGCAEGQDQGQDGEQQDGGEQGGGEQGGQEDGQEQDTEMAQVRVAHLSPDAPNVDVYVDGEAALEDVAYSDVSDYIELEPGMHDIRITEAGADEAIYEESLDIQPGAYTLAALGEVGEENQPFSVEVFEDDLSDPGENARLRVIHAAPDAPAVTITEPESGDALAESLAFGAAESGEAPPGEYTLEVRPADAEPDSEPVATFDVSLEAGTVYTGFAIGYLEPDAAPADEEFELLVVEDSSGMNGGGGGEGGGMDGDGNETA